MRPLTEPELRAVFVNARDEELEHLQVPLALMVTDWELLDFVAWVDARARGRGYIVVEIDERPVGIVLRANTGSSGARAGMCNICHTMQPGDQVRLFAARRAGRAGEEGGSVGTYICADLSCHENVRLAAPLAPNEVRASVDRRIDGAARRTRALVEQVLDGAQPVSHGGAS